MELQLAAMGLYAQDRLISSISHKGGGSNRHLILLHQSSQRPKQSSTIPYTLTVQTKQ